MNDIETKGIIGSRTKKAELRLEYHDYDGMIQV